MNNIGFALAVLAIVTIAAWAYNINYRTATALDHIAELRGRIAAEREALQVLKVEWAYMNAPERLRSLVASNNEYLRLAPMTPESFGNVAAVPFPPVDEQEALDQLIAQVLVQPFSFGAPRAADSGLPPEASALQTGLAGNEAPLPAPRPRWTE